MPRKRDIGKSFLALLPHPLHAALRKAAETHARDKGGQVNLNREIVRCIYTSTRDTLSPVDRARIETWLG